MQKSPVLLGLIVCDERVDPWSERRHNTGPQSPVIQGLARPLFLLGRPLGQFQQVLAFHQQVSVGFLSRGPIPPSSATIGKKWPRLDC